MEPTAQLAELKETHERGAKLIGGYTAFVAALLVATMAKSSEYPHAWILISLFAISLPSLVAAPLLDHLVRVRQQRKRSMFRGLAFLFGSVPSLAGIAGLIGHFSAIASVLFVLLVLVWSFTLDVVTYLGAQSSDSEV